MLYNKQYKQGLSMTKQQRIELIKECVTIKNYRDMYTLFNKSTKELFAHEYNLLNKQLLLTKAHGFDFLQVAYPELFKD